MKLIDKLLQSINNLDFFDTYEGLIGGNLIKAYKDFEKLFPDAVMVGGLAVDQYIEEPMLTRDVDIVATLDTILNIQADDFDTIKLSRKFHKLFRETTENEKGDLIHKSTGTPIDLVIASKSKLIPYLMKNLDKYSIVKDNIRIMKPEVIVAMKSIRPVEDPRHPKAGKDKVSIEGLLRAYPDLDIGELQKYLSKDNIKLIDKLRKHILGDNK
jgi:hypothetical protein